MASAGSDVAQVAAGPLLRGVADRDHPLAAAFAHHQHEPLVEPQARQRETHQLAHPQTGRVDQLDHALVAQPERRRRVGGRQQPLHLRLVEHRREMARALGKEEVRRGIVGAVALADQEPVEAADRHQGAALGGGGEAGAAQALEVLGERRLVRAQRIAAAGGGERRREPLEVAAIGVDGVARAAALDRQRFEEPIERSPPGLARIW